MSEPGMLGNVTMKPSDQDFLHPIHKTAISDKGTCWEGEVSFKQEKNTTIEKFTVNEFVMHYTDIIMLTFKDRVRLVNINKKKIHKICTLLPFQQSASPENKENAYARGTYVFEHMMMRTSTLPRHRKVEITFKLLTCGAT